MTRAHNLLEGIEYIAGWLLQLIPQEYNMELGWGYDDMIGYTEVVSVSTSCSKCHNLIFLSDFGIVMGGYSKIILIISCHTFFFNEKMACSSSVSVFIANASNSIMKSAVFLFPYLKVSIFYSASAAFILLLNVFLIFHMKSSQFWLSFSLSSSSSFFCV